MIVAIGTSYAWYCSEEYDSVQSAENAVRLQGMLMVLNGADWDQERRERETIFYNNLRGMLDNARLEYDLCMRRTQER